MKRLLPLLPLILAALLLASCGSPAEPYYSEGNAHYENGEYEEAIADFTEAIRLDSNHAESYYGRGLAHCALGRYEDAIDDYTEAIALDPNLADAYCNRGGAYLELGEYEEAIADCTEAIRLDPNLAIAYCNRGGAHLELADYNEAISDCGEAIRLDPDLAMAYSNRGVAHYELGNYEETIDDCTEAIRLDPSLAIAYCNRGLAHYQLAHYGQAIDDCTEAIRLDPDLPLAYTGRGAAHNALGEYEEAVDDCTQAVRLDPNLAMAYSNRGVAHYELGNHEEAIDDCSQAIELDSQCAEAYFYRCRARGQLGKYEEAIDDCTEAIRLEPTHADAYTSRGAVYDRLGEPERAMADYDEAIRLDPNLARAYYNRGLLHGDLGEFQEAIEDFTEAIRLDPDDAWVYYYRGLARQTLGDYEDAISDYSEAVGIDPDLAEAYHERGLAHYHLGEYEEAAADRAEAIRLEPDYATDLSDVVLTSEDLGLGFLEVPLGELGLTVEDLSQEGFTVESISAFMQAEPFEMVMDLTSLASTEFEQASFDVALRNPDFLLAGIVTGLGATDILEERELPGLNDIGDVSVGLTVVADMEGFPLRMDLVVSRRGIVGAFTLVMYLDGEEPTLPVGDVARKFDHKIETLLPGMASSAAPAPPPEEPDCALRVGMVSDIGGIDDASFNQKTWEGVVMAEKELGICGQFIESQAQADYEKNIIEFAEQDYDLIITVGFLLGDATAKMAEQYPDINFAIVDFAYSPGIPNVQGIVFATDEAAFLSGYLGAYWAHTQDPDDPQCGYVAGMQIPTVELFVAGHDAGIKYYNEQHGANVQWKGVYVGEFEAPDEGKIQGNLLIDEGVDVIYGIGGKTGNGGLTAAKERGKWGVGVDVDQYNTLPNEKDILITSTIKRLDNAVYGTIEGLLEGEFAGGSVYLGTLDNSGVGIAPFHDFEGQIPEDIVQELNEITMGIINGTIDTGW